MKKILFYGLDDKRAGQYQDIGADFGIEVRIIGDDGLHSTVKHLFDMEDDLPNLHLEFKQEFMIIQNMTKDEVLNLLNAFARRNISFTGIKVMSTQNNDSWLLEKLFLFAQQETKKAVETIKLRQLVESCNGIDLTSVKEDQAYAFKKALNTASRLINSKNSSLESIVQASQKLARAKAGARKLFN